MSIYAYWVSFILVAAVLAEAVARVRPWGRWSWLTRSLVICLLLTGLVALTLSLVGVTGTMGDQPLMANLASICTMVVLGVPWLLATFQRRWKEGDSHGAQ